LQGSSVDNDICQCEKRHRSACYGAAEYKHGDEGYCILHLPSESKKDDFKKALQSRLERNDFNFVGVYFPSGFGDFREVDFSEVADFSEATFSKGAYFSGATFSEVVGFSRANFSERANFSRATFSERASFVGATFNESAAFWHLQTLPQTVLLFWDAATEKPERISFRTTFLRPSGFVDVDAQKFEFSDVAWFELPNGEEVNLEHEIRVLEEQYLEDRSFKQPHALRKLARACTTLMKNVEENRDYPTANEFHYWSMEAGRKESCESKKEAWRKFSSRLSRIGRRLGSVAALYWTWRSLRRRLKRREFGFRTRFDLIPTLYWALSGYGERPRRAFWVLVAIWLAFAALYLFLADSAPFWVFSASNIWEGIDYARQAGIYSLSALARLNPEPKPQELGWFQTLVTLEGILGPLQIGLLLLAVRRKVMR